MKSIIISLVYTVFVGLFLAISSYSLYRDTDAILDRAQIAADRDDMTEYLEELKENMINHNIDRGHTALIFKTKANDLALHFKTVERITERLDEIKNIPKSDTAYQVALDDIRGTIRELPNPTAGVVWVRYWFLFFGFGIWLWPVIMAFLSL